MSGPDDTQPTLSTILLRGFSKRCARCGRGELYRRWTALHKHCPECGLRLLENQGDPWFFQLLIDRALFVLPVIAALFFGLHKSNMPLFIGYCVALVAFFIYTTPHRYGACVALDYYSRLRAGPSGGESGDEQIERDHSGDGEQ